MLNLILGMSGTGKTQLILTNIKQRAENKKHSILIVPEQFSSAAEIRAYSVLGDECSAFVTVCSFSAYAEKILKEYGGTAIKTLSEAGRVVYVRRAMDAVRDELVKYKSNRRSARFCAMCCDVITELKTAGATPNSLQQLSKTSKDSVKLRELGLIFAAYNALLENTAADPSDRLTIACEKPFEKEIVHTAVFVDNFDGFTAPEYKLLEKLLLAESCTISLCCDSLKDKEGGLGLTSPVKKTAMRLRSMAAKKSVAVAVPILLENDYRHSNSLSLAYISQCLGKGEAENAPTSSNEFFLNEYKSTYEETRAVAAHIKSLAFNNVSYAEIAVVCREADDYFSLLEGAFTSADIPFFFDETSLIEFTAPARFLTAALELAKTSLSSENILRLLKTGICGIDIQRLSKLENYAYTWNLSAKAWREPFVLNPMGFGETDIKGIELLADLEQLRLEIISKIENFILEVKSENALKVSRALYLLAQSFNAGENTLASVSALEKRGSVLLAERVRRSWDMCMEFLSEMSLLLSDTKLSIAEYSDLLLILMRNSKMGSVPMAQNTVLVTTADRMRLESPQYCFVLGASQGKFPKTVGVSGLLTHTDREGLIANGVEMPGGFENRVLLEQMFFYKALTASKKGLYVSFIPARFGVGDMCLQLEELINNIKPHRAILSEIDMCSTPAAALEYLCETDFVENESNAAVLMAISQFDEQKKGISAMLAVRSKGDFEIDKQGLMRDILGGDLSISPTRVERYYTCRFAYYLEYVLGIKARRKAELSPLESGSLVHYVLEKALKLCAEDFTLASKEKLEKLAFDLTDEYVTLKMPNSTERFAQIILRIKSAVARLLCFMQDEQKQSSFHPVAFEEVIGKDGIKPLELKTVTGETVRVIGTVDRVDVMTREGKDYIRVVDYKTGSKSFSLDEVYCGLNTQMLLYLFTICAHGKDKYNNASPAGVLYLMADPAPKTTDRQNAHKDIIYSMDGILIDDTAILHSMDKGSSGIFIPVRFKNDGTPYKSAKLASLEKLGRIEKHIEGLVGDMAYGLYSGKIFAKPLVSKAYSPCDVCDYRPVCCHEDGENEAEIIAPENCFEEAVNEMD